MIISILGILKSGGAYVPIDPEYPKERIEYIERDSNFKVVVDDELIKEFKNNVDKVIYLDISQKEAIWRLFRRDDSARSDETLPALNKL